MTTIEELLSLAEDVEQAKASLLEKSIQEPLEALRDACNEATRAWSGSNIGYHAAVYYHDLQPSPPTAPFSAEWGIEDHWPVHQTDPGWEMMDHRGVMDTIIARAGGANPDDIEIQISPIRERFSVIKEHAISILLAHNATQPDDFLSKKRQEIESIKVSHPASIARGFLPQKGYTSRDSLAMHQGLRTAPHQVLIAVPRSAKSLEGAMGMLENAVRLSAAHMQRIARGKQKMKTDGKTLFIGHGQSLVWRVLKDFLVDRLQLCVEEFNSVSTAGIPTVTRLSAMLDSAAFAFLVMTAEDEQPDGKVRARSNVIHEAGLFQGRLGFGRAIVILEEGCEEFSNIRGLGEIRFSKGRINECFEEVRRVLEREEIIH